MSHEHACEFDARRDEILVAYLYGESDSAQSADAEGPRERALFEAHLVRCDACRRELAELDAVRRQLGKWAPPQPQGPLTGWSTGVSASAGSAAPARRSVWDSFSPIPAWAQAVAALLMFGLAAGIANLQIRYDDSGLSVSTGWSAPARTAAATAATASPPAGVPDWRRELTALEERLRTEMRAASDVRAAADAPGRIEILQQVRRMLDESERRQQRELALRVAEVASGVQAQRQADLVRIDRSQRALQQETGLEVQRNRQLIDYIVRTSQRP
jgi:hypothetical protein